MKYVKPCKSKIVTEQSLLDHVKEVSDYCNCYEIYLNNGQGRIKDVAEKFLSLLNGQINTTIGRGFIKLKPFLITEKEAIYGFNATKMECRFSILRSSETDSIFYLIILINYSSKFNRYLLWLIGLAIRSYLINCINKTIQDTK